MKRLNLSILLLGFFLFSCKKEASLVSKPPKKTYSICGAKATDIDWYQTNSKAPLLEGVDVLDFEITTENELVQKYVNQGLLLAYGFNHAEAARSFFYASKLDPDCAMCFWGYAYVLGPNYNAGMESDNYQRAYDAIQEAKRLAPETSLREQMLIDALSRRYSPEAPEDRGPLDRAYSEAMREVFEVYADDADIAALYAESVMDLHPWDLWGKDGSIRSWTPEILAAIEQVFTINPAHPGAHHFYIHAVEASKEPEKGLKSAALFDQGIASGAGHLVHMPSHIYIRTGDYHKGTLSNIQAAKVDSSYVSACHAQGAYPLGYYPHNYHFMAGTATLEGNRKYALEGAKKVAAHAHPEIMKEPGWGTLQHYYTIPYYIYVKFGMWEEILTEIKHDPLLKYPNAVRHYARGMAFLAKNDIEKAREELAKLEILSEDEEMEAVTVWDINSVATLLQIARRVLYGEILASEGEYDGSIDALLEAVEIEDNLNYNEPPDWFFSVRHHLGAIQIEAGKYKAAIKSYEEDLDRLPKNGWALHGMKLAYQKMGQTEKIAPLDQQIAEAWASADITLESSRVK